MKKQPFHIGADFAAKLQNFADTLNSQERHILREILRAAQDPIHPLRWAPVEDGLDVPESELLAQLRREWDQRLT